MMNCILILVDNNVFVSKLFRIIIREIDDIGFKRGRKIIEPIIASYAQSTAS